MAQILVRNLSEETVEEFKKRARMNKRSLEAEVRLFLEDEAQRHQRRQEFIELARKIRDANGPQTTDSVDLIREDRER